MTNTKSQQGSLTREERLAAKLRENLRRRKQQARGVASRDDASGPDAPADADALSKRDQDG